MDLFNFQLPEGWFLSENDNAEALFCELHLELIPGHPLYAADIEVLAHREGTDDILVRHTINPDRFTVVHLSWSLKPEINKEHPTVEYDGDYAGFLEYERSWAP
jgi:hypothetical protein